MSSVTPIESLSMIVYVVMAIDEHEHDRILAVCMTAENAKRYCTKCQVESDYFDIWIERHVVLN
jgi:hypothetical protein